MRNTNEPTVYIVTLNWNGDIDTIGLLNSLSKLDYISYEIILIDNGSSINSFNRLLFYIQKEDCYQFKFINNDLGNNFALVGTGNKISFFRSEYNLGFAKGSNLGIQYVIEQLGGNFVLLLNNDTEVLPNFLSILMERYLINPEFGAVIPQIRYFEDKDIIWNCGGRLFFGFRKYFYANKNVSQLKNKNELEVSFATGCALLFKPNEVGLLTDKFFFGEEDFEFAYRMRNMRKKMLCVLDSIIYHKVGQSINRNGSKTNKGAIFVYYLNRFINMRDQFKYRFLWEFWRIFYFIYIFILLRSQFRFFELIRFIAKLWGRSNTLYAVNKDEFDMIMKSMN